MVDIFNVEYIDNFKILLTSILIYVIIYSLLLKMKILGSSKEINSLVAIVSAVIVSFTGIVTYMITYTLNLMVVLLMIFLLIFILLLFLGVKLDDIHNFFSNNSKIVIIIFILIFGVIFLKGFFGVNNTFDINEPQDNSYDVNTEFNTGVDDITNSEFETSSVSSFFSNIFENEMIGVVLFLLIIGLFVFLIG